MTQPGFPAVREAIATYLTSSTGVNATANRFDLINPPMAVVVPQTGRIISYSETFDEETNYYLRVILLASKTSSTWGQDVMDPYLSPAGDQSIYAAVQADPTLGGVVSWAIVVEATGYGVQNWNGVDYLACSLVMNVGT